MALPKTRASCGCWLVLIVLPGAAASIWLFQIRPIQRHTAFCQRVRADLESLFKTKPPDVTRKQWNNVVAWTLNAHGNCLTYQRDIPAAEMVQFEAELSRRLNGQVTLATIDWIWDEIVRLTSHGKDYSDRWRPTTAERLREFEETNSSWAGVEVD